HSQGSGGPPLGEEGAAPVEFLDAVVVVVPDVDVPAAVGCHGVGSIELAVAAARGPPLGEEGAAPVEFLDAVVPGVGDVEIPGSVGCTPARSIELAVTAAKGAPLGHEEGRRGGLTTEEPKFIGDGGPAKSRTVSLGVCSDGEQDFDVARK